ncbi:MAG: hypothetical protein M1530_02500 [Candidatus Marsarchaeota archaeon]|nr:hypothetical protein [Candidatus Marsarchaeota archaeon]
MIKSGHQQVNASIVAHLTGAMKLEGVYVSLALSAKVLRQRLQREGADVSKLYFIDASGTSRGAGSGEEGCTCVRGPASLTELSIAITRQMDAKPYGFFFFDSASAVADSNPAETAERFFRYLFNKMEEHEVLLIVAACPCEKLDRVLPALAEFADQYAEIG